LTALLKPGPEEKTMSKTPRNCVSAVPPFVMVVEMR
jgi:hypothetical protein